MLSNTYWVVRWLIYAGNIFIVMVTTYRFTHRRNTVQEAIKYVGGAVTEVAKVLQQQLSVGVADQQQKLLMGVADSLEL